MRVRIQNSSRSMQVMIQYIHIFYELQMTSVMLIIPYEQIASGRHDLAPGVAGGLAVCGWLHISA